MSPLTENLLTAAVTVVPLALLAVALRAWRHARTARTLLLAAAFAVWALKGLFLSVALFADPDWSEHGLVGSLAFDVAALGLVYAAVLRR